MNNPNTSLSSSLFMTATTKAAAKNQADEAQCLLAFNATIADLLETVAGDVKGSGGELGTSMTSANNITTTATNQTTTTTATESSPTSTTVDSGVPSQQDLAEILATLAITSAALEKVSDETSNTQIQGVAAMCQAQVDVIENQIMDYEAAVTPYMEAEALFNQTIDANHDHYHNQVANGNDKKFYDDMGWQTPEAAEVSDEIQDVCNEVCDQCGIPRITLDLPETNSVNDLCSAAEAQFDAMCDDAIASCGATLEADFMSDGLFLNMLVTKVSDGGESLKEIILDMTSALKQLCSAIGTLQAGGPAALNLVLSALQLAMSHLTSETAKAGTSTSLSMAGYNDAVAQGSQKSIADLIHSIHKQEKKQKKAEQKQKWIKVALIVLTVVSVVVAGLTCGAAVGLAVLACALATQEFGGHKSALELVMQDMNKALISAGMSSDDAHILTDCVLVVAALALVTVGAAALAESGAAVVAEASVESGTGVVAAGAGEATVVAAETTGAATGAATGASAGAGAGAGAGAATTTAATTTEALTQTAQLSAKSWVTKEGILAALMVTGQTNLIGDSTRAAYDDNSDLSQKQIDKKVNEAQLYGNIALGVAALGVGCSSSIESNLTNVSDSLTKALENQKALIMGLSQAALLSAGVTQGALTIELAGITDETAELQKDQALDLVQIQKNDTLIQNISQVSQAQSEALGTLLGQQVQMQKEIAENALKFQQGWIGLLQSV